MKNSHFSFRFFPNATNQYFLPPGYVKRMAESVKGEFSPYKDFELNYQMYSAWGLSKDPAEDHTYFGTLKFKKITNANNNYSEYKIERKIHGIMNSQNDAKPESITVYSQTVFNDMLCSIPTDSTMEYEYRIKRKYYNNDIPEVYGSVEKVYIDENYNILLGTDNNKTVLGKSSNKLFTNFSILDALQKIAVSDKYNELNMKMDMLENMETLKTGLDIKYIGTIEAVFDDYEISLLGYCQTGTAITPTFYWITEKGLLIAVKKSASFMVLTTA